jgi:galactonate dehydratase
MTPDLTRNVDRFKLPIMGVAGDAPMASKHDGAGQYSNIVTVAESPLMPGLLWIGTNDGNLQVSRDGGATWKNVAAGAKEKYAQGYRAVKMNATAETAWVDSYKVVDEVCRRVAAIRDALGYDMDVALDFHGRVHKATARVLMKELEQYKLMFVEEPVLCENEEAFAELRRHATMPIATGERNFTRWGFKNLITCGGVDIVQPDVSHAGGILELRKIAAMAEAWDVAVAPHCPLGPIALAACLQLDFCTPNAFIQEQSLGIHYNQGSDLLDYLQDKAAFGYADGYVKKPDAPGLGIEINEDKVREMAKAGHDWKNPVWRNADGSVAEWRRGAQPFRTRMSFVSLAAPTPPILRDFGLP